MKEGGGGGEGAEWSLERGSNEAAEGAWRQATLWSSAPSLLSPASLDKPAADAGEPSREEAPRRGGDFSSTRTSGRGVSCSTQTPRLTDYTKKEAARSACGQTVITPGGAPSLLVLPSMELGRARSRQHSSSASDEARPSSPLLLLSHTAPPAADSVFICRVPPLTSINSSSQSLPLSFPFRVLSSLHSMLAFAEECSSG